MPSTKLSITIVIPALNEETNLPDAIRSVTRAARVVVVDSQSTDATARVAAGLGAEVVQFHHDPHLGVKKKNWALENLSIETPWTLILDADERLTEALWTEIATRITDERYAAWAAWALDREFIFMGRQLRCFRPNWNVRLFRTGKAKYEDLGLHDIPGSGDNEIHEHMVVEGAVGYIRDAALLHNDYRGIGPWIDRHNKYATWEALLYARLKSESAPSLITLLKSPPIERKRHLRRVWAVLPFRPFLRFSIWYFVRGGILDGPEGLQFCLLMSWYERLIVIKAAEIESNNG